MENRWKKMFGGSTGYALLLLVGCVSWQCAFAALSVDFQDLNLLSTSGLQALEASLHQHKVVIIKGAASIDVEELRRITRFFGELHVHLESSSHFPGYSDVNVVSNIRNNETGQINGLYGVHVESYHSDLSWAELPTKYTLLKSVVRSANCGDTHFINTNDAYDDLSTELKERLNGLQGNYCYLKTRNLDFEVGLTAEEVAQAQNCAVHPIITTHPITGRKNIYANPSHTSNVIGLSAEESDALLQTLFTHSQQDKYLYAHKWSDDDLIIWDNRSLWHRGTGCPEDQPRMLIRTTVLNDVRPV